MSIAADAADEFMRWQMHMQDQRSAYAKSVICELCKTGQCPSCVRPCTCLHQGD